MWLYLTDPTNGSQWVNLEQLLAISFDDAGDAPAAKVFWAHSHLITHEAAEIEALRQWVKQRKYQLVASAP